MELFSFPDRIQSREELKRDILYQKIPEKDRESVCDMAWERGTEVLKEITVQCPEIYIREIMAAEGIKLICRKKDEVRGKLRFLGEYDSADQTVVLYEASVAKWAVFNHLEACVAEDMVLAHEFFHYLECVKIGETSKLYQVPVIRIGSVCLSRSGIRALSEIAANGFARAYFEYFCILQARKCEKAKERLWNR